MLERLFSRLELKIPPPVVIVFAGLLNRLGRDWGQVPFDPPRILIISLIVVSGMLGVGGLIGCFRGRTTVHPWSPDETTTLVTHGVYRFSRNPMYFGLVLLLAAYYLYDPTLLSPIGLILVIWFLTRFQILPEERILHRKFGEQYAQYALLVRRWL